MCTLSAGTGLTCVNLPRRRVARIQFTDRKTQLNLWYALAAMIAAVLIQQW